MERKILLTAVLFIFLSNQYYTLLPGYQESNSESLQIKAFESIEEEAALEKAAKEEQKQLMKALLANENPFLAVRTIVIDPGHGGWDPGAIGPSGLKEKDVTLKVALKLENILKEKTKYRVVLTRRGDYYVDLSERVIIANQYDADLFLSIHINGSKKRTSQGLETYFCSLKASDEEAAKVAALENSVLEDDAFFIETENFINDEWILFNFERKLYWQKSGDYADIFLQSLKKYTTRGDRGVKFASFYVLRKNQMPSVLLEIGFISNQEEERLLKRDDFLDFVAEGIAGALMNFDF